MSENAPFGALAPSSAQETARRLAASLPANWFGRKTVSLLLGPAGGRRRRAFDVTVFGTQKARLHPYDNLCEKSVYIAPQLWEGTERAALGAAIAASDDDTFFFLDIGANAGLYALFARSAAQQAGRRLSAACVEPAPDMLARLAFNIAASGAGEDVRVLPYAAAGADGSLRFAVDAANRGESHLDETGEMVVEARTVLRLLSEWGAPRVDALKIDIEGHEFPVLDAFLRDAPPALLPGLVVMEFSHEAENAPAAARLLGAGYREKLRTKRNLVAVRDA